MDIVQWFGQLFNSMPSAIAQGFIWGIMAIGVYITYRILDIADLTVDGTVSLGGAVAAMLITSQVQPWCDPWVAMIVVFFAGMAAGFVTGILHTVMGIPAILAGILTQLALYSVNLRIQGKSNVAIAARSYKVLVTGNSTLLHSFGFNNPIWLLILFTAGMIAVMYMFFGTEYGCGLRAIGANQQMARAQGINTSKGKVVGLMLSNGIVAMSGALLAQFSGSADVKKGTGAIVIGLAAVIIGEVIFGKVFKNFALKLLSVAIGAILYYLIIQVVLMMGLNTDDLKLLTALVVAVFLAVPYWRSKTKGNTRSRGGAGNVKA